MRPAITSCRPIHSRNPTAVKTNEDTSVVMMPRPGDAADGGAEGPFRRLAEALGRPAVSCA